MKCQCPKKHNCNDEKQCDQEADTIYNFVPMCGWCSRHQDDPDQPAEYPMIEGEGAPQYTFSLPAEPTQLALL